VVGLDGRTGTVGAGHKVGLLDLTVHHQRTIRFLLCPSYVRRMAKLFADLAQKLDKETDPPVFDARDLVPAARPTCDAGHTKQLPTIEYVGGYDPARPRRDDDADTDADFDTALDGEAESADSTTITIASAHGARPGSVQGIRSLTDDEVRAAWARFTTSDTTIVALAAGIGVSDACLGNHFRRLFGEAAVSIAVRVHRTIPRGLAAAARDAHVRAHAERALGRQPILKPSGGVL
jgi:hypothetical protein